ncbi:hypothetical protein WR25_05119 [Diploscapter pachys]|uniref:Uncharacterized protein n=1 Tax=Diploscapter pachys TaxID=2018661 RepID=A0A2A2M4R5_9BILA|nr:hypothetical protein WR25_05119 [Diploscapter pachys]
MGAVRHDRRAACDRRRHGAVALRRRAGLCGLVSRAARRGAVAAGVVPCRGRRCAAVRHARAAAVEQRLCQGGDRPAAAGGGHGNRLTRDIKISLYLICRGGAARGNPSKPLQEHATWLLRSRPTARTPITSSRTSASPISAAPKSRSPKPRCPA